MSSFEGTGFEEKGVSREVWEIGGGKMIGGKKNKSTARFKGLPPCGLDGLMVEF